MNHLPTMAPTLPPFPPTMRLPTHPSSPNTNAGTQLSTASVERTAVDPGKCTATQNYSQCDVAALFSIVEKIEPIGGNDCASVANKFAY